MKIMYVDTSNNGHHETYLQCLMSSEQYDSIAVVPAYQRKNLQPGIYTLSQGFYEKKLLSYLRWMNEIRRIASIEKPDIIHILDGDSIMRYFGIGFKSFKSMKVIVTFHHFFTGLLRKTSYKSILHHVNTGVVHTKEIAGYLHNYDIDNVNVIQYPCFFDFGNRLDSNNSKPASDVPVLLALGGTRYDKGIDILLQALNEVKTPFYIIVAGKEEFFKREQLEELSQKYRTNIKIELKFLSDEELLNYLVMTDFIVLPYRKVFDGASGPLCEGAYLEKTIIGPNYGSLGGIIHENHLGYTFESEQVSDLARVIDKALLERPAYDETAQQFRKSLDKNRFLEDYQNLYGEML